MLFFADDKIISAVQAGNKPIAPLAAFGTAHGVNGNVWQHYIAHRILSEENALTLALERGERGSIYTLAAADFNKLFDLFFATPSTLFGTEAPLIARFQTTTTVKDERLTRLTRALQKATDATRFQSIAARFLKKEGIGIFGAYHAFRLETDGNDITLAPIIQTDTRPLDHLVGYELQKQKVRDNTLAFLDGKNANNTLLYGDAGTGKSSTIKGLLHDYAARGLRVIELYKHQYNALPRLIDQLRQRPFKFILYLDDLSFEEFEVEYKYFKAVLEGGLSVKPHNVLIYATSNRRHLIKETWADRNDMRGNDEVNTSDSLQEKLSLSARFGLTVYYPSPGQQEYLAIVKELATRQGIALPEDELTRRALQWSLRSTGKSGRTAEQFIHSLSSIKD